MILMEDLVFGESDRKSLKQAYFLLLKCASLMVLIYCYDKFHILTV
jgi:hypothetical protein